MAAFVVYENVLAQAYRIVDKSAMSGAAVTGINLGSGLAAGLAAAVVSQPADTVLSKINRDQGVPGEGSLRRLWRVVGETGFRGSFAGTRARLAMVGGMTAVQFAIYGDVKEVSVARAPGSRCLGSLWRWTVALANTGIGSWCNWGDRDQVTK